MKHAHRWVDVRCWKMYWGMTSTSSGWQSTSDWGHYETSTRRDDVLLTTSTGEGTSYVTNDGRLDDESDVDPPREPSLDGVEVVLFFEPEPASSEPKELKGVQMMKKKICDSGRDRTGSSLDSSELEVGKEFSNEDSFLGALKQHSINHRVNYNVVKSKSERFEAKCVVKDGVSQVILRWIQGSLWDWTHHRYYLRHVASNYFRQYRSTIERWQVTNMVPHGVVDYYELDSSLVQLSVGVVVAPVVGVGRMTHFDRIKNVEVFASPTAEVFESHKAIGIANEMSSLMMPHVVSLMSMAYISSVESEPSRKEMHRAMHSNLA
ncbi:hypothetical protein J1N35_015321 [Gossypium stocksii]|uniref:Transposase MuDR plant domain-containing protein n=1 Tax=Gossypium stocksii TaxID=47602 RepID=A0A9D3VWQ5_9ROSI|nr:hypothetical protein J1N35_015321 [Gossypium stocksii]